MEINYTPKNFSSKKIDATVEQIIAEAEAPSAPTSKRIMLESLDKEMRVNDFMRRNLAVA